MPAARLSEGMAFVHTGLAAGLAPGAALSGAGGGRGGRLAGVRGVRRAPGWSPPSPR